MTELGHRSASRLPSGDGTSTPKSGRNRCSAANGEFVPTPDDPVGPTLIGAGLPRLPLLGQGQPERQRLQRMEMDVLNSPDWLASDARGVEVVDLTGLLVEEVEGVEPNDQAVVELVAEACR